MCTSLNYVKIYDVDYNIGNEIDIKDICESIENEIGLYPIGYSYKNDIIKFVFNESLTSKEVYKINKVMKYWKFKVIK